MPAEGSGVSPALLEALRCPFCRLPLSEDAGGLVCNGCARRFEVVDSIARMLHPELPGARMKLAETEGGVEKAKAEGWYEPNDTIDAVLPFPNRELEGFEDLTSLAKHLPFADGDFDITYCVATLHHALGLPLMVAEMARDPTGRSRGSADEGTRGPFRSSENPAQDGEKALGINEHVHTVWAYLAAFARAGLIVRRVERSEGWPPEPWGGTLSKIPKVG
jgi:uncharacterized protein YbaR (Trm112 family)